MWTFLKSGFYSAVQDRDDPALLLVRCRAKADMEATGWSFDETEDADYRYRARVPKAVYADFMAGAVMDIDYPNFKDAVAERAPDRAKLYTEVWWILRELQEKG
jgi:hypothetical protein